MPGGSRALAEREGLAPAKPRSLAVFKTVPTIALGFHLPRSRAIPEARDAFSDTDS
jgi:hypothetical protein